MAQKTSSPPRKLVFEVGARLEAMDFTQNWYSAKICRIDEKEKKALIHFEGWNHRYDEWIKFDSDRLRPHNRLHLFQESKEERKDECDYQDWNVGDRVLAKWLDCKYYSAKVVKCNPEGSCEVLFYDGVKKTVQRSNMKPDNKKTILMPAIKDLDAGERQRRKIEMASARAARARKRSREEAGMLAGPAVKRKERMRRATSLSSSTEDLDVPTKGGETSHADPFPQRDVPDKGGETGPALPSPQGEVPDKRGGTRPALPSPQRDVPDKGDETSPALSSPQGDVPDKESETRPVDGSPQREVTKKTVQTSPAVSSLQGEVPVKDMPVHASPEADVKEIAEPLAPETGKPVSTKQQLQQQLQEISEESYKQALRELEEHVSEEPDKKEFPEAGSSASQEAEKEVLQEAEKEVLQEPEKERLAEEEKQILPEVQKHTLPDSETQLSTYTVQDVSSKPEIQESLEPGKQVLSEQEKQVSPDQGQQVSPLGLQTHSPSDKGKQDSARELKPLVFVKYKTEEECLQSPPTEKAAVRVSSDKTRRHAERAPSSTIDLADFKTVGKEEIVSRKDLHPESHGDGNVHAMETDRSPIITEGTLSASSHDRGSAFSGDSHKYIELYTDSTTSKPLVEAEVLNSAQFDHSSVGRGLKNTRVKGPRVSDVRWRVRGALSSIGKKPKLKYTSAGPRLKTTRTRGGKTTSRKRGRGSRTGLNPRGYGYSMAFMPPQMSGNDVEQNETSAAETGASLEEGSGGVAAASMGAAKPAAVKSQSYQAKKLRLDQITGKLSAQRQCEAQASAKSPSAFQATSHSPPPPHMPTSPVSLPPAKAPSPSSVPSPYPMESYPPALLYGHSLAPPCCSNPHHQHPPVYPPPGPPPPHGSIPHGMHLQGQHIHPHQEFHPVSSGYRVYSPHQSGPFPRPCMAGCCQLYHPLSHDGPSPPPHESALVRLMQCEQRMLHPNGGGSCFRERSPAGPWMAGPRHTQGPSSHYIPGPPTHEDLWRPPAEGLPRQTSPSPSLSPGTTSDSPLGRQQSKRSRKNGRPLPTNTKGLPAVPTSAATSAVSTQSSGAADADKTDQGKHDKELDQLEKEPIMPRTSENRQPVKMSGMSPVSKAPPSTVGANPGAGAPSAAPFVPGSIAAAFTGSLQGSRPRKGKEGLAPKELVIEIDHNKHKCQVPGCDKSFRKESGLEYHMKYYHSEKNGKRKRTSASARLDSGSDISPESSGPRKTKRRFHRYSAPGHLSTDPSPLLSPMSAPEVELGTNATEGPGEKPEQEQEIEPGTESEGFELGAGESVEVEEEDDHDTDVIRCICNEIEEGGFMIQCEQCLTWQHSDCLGLTEETVPSNYLCHCCSNPKGLRMNAKYRNDHDWFRRGTLSSFPFLHRGESEYEVELTCATHELVSDVHNVNTVLQSLRVRLELLGDPSDPQVELWKNPERDAAGTGGSAEAETTKGGGPEEAAMPSEKGTAHEKQPGAGVKVKTEPCVNGVQASDGSADSSDRSMQVAENKPEGESQGVGLGVVREGVSPSSPLPALIPANGAEQVGRVDVIKKEDVEGFVGDQVTGPKNEGPKEAVPSPMEVGSKDTGIPDSTKPMEARGVSQGEVSGLPAAPAPREELAVSSQQPLGSKEVNTRDGVEKNSSKEPLSAVENLMDDITMLHDDMEVRMSQIDKQLSVLEDAYATPFPPDRKPDLRKLVKDLGRVRRMLHHVR